MKNESPHPETVQEYLAGIAEPMRSTLTKIRAAIRSAVPEQAIEVISYRMPAFKHKKIIVWYAAFAGHCSLFPGASVVALYRDELKKYVVSKGTIRFPVDKPLPAALVRKLVRARMAEIEGKDSPK